MGVGGGGPGTRNAHPYIYIYTVLMHLSISPSNSVSKIYSSWILTLLYLHPSAIHSSAANPDPSQINQ